MAAVAGPGPWDLYDSVEPSIDSPDAVPEHLLVHRAGQTIGAILERPPAGSRIGLLPSLRSACDDEDRAWCGIADGARHAANRESHEAIDAASAGHDVQLRSVGPRCLCPPLGERGLDAWSRRWGPGSASDPRGVRPLPACHGSRCGDGGADESQLQGTGDRVGSAGYPSWVGGRRRRIAVGTRLPEG